jgi:putative transcriptional regulator
MTKSYFSENLKTVRKNNKISLETLAEAIGVSKSAISDYENDKFSPTLAVANKIAGFFKLSIDSLEYQKIHVDEAGLLILPEQTNLLPLQNSDNEQLLLLRKNFEALQIELRLAKQKIEGQQIQIRLNDQLRNSKLSEIELLKTQILLLEEKLKLSL